jgi:hypothetical protein
MKVYVGGEVGSWSAFVLVDGDEEGRVCCREAAMIGAVPGKPGAGQEST